MPVLFGYRVVCKVTLLAPYINISRENNSVFYFKTLKSLLNGADATEASCESNAFIRELEFLIFPFHNRLLLLLPEKGVNKLATVEHLQLVDALADTDIAHGNMELVADANHNTTLGCAI